jgi:hypothetical protein
MDSGFLERTNTLPVLMQIKECAESNLLELDPALLTEGPDDESQAAVLSAGGQQGRHLATLGHTAPRGALRDTRPYGGQPGDRLRARQAPRPGGQGHRGKLERHHAAASGSSPRRSGRTASAARSSPGLTRRGSSGTPRPATPPATPCPASPCHCLLGLEPAQLAAQLITMSPFPSLSPHP